MRKKTFKVLIYLVLAAIFFTSCGTKKDATDTLQSQKEYIPVEIGVAKKDVIFNSTIVTGKIAGKNDIAVSPKFAGKIIDMPIKVGDVVSEGQVLMVLDQSDANERVKQAKASLEGAETGVEQAKFGVNQANDVVTSAKANYDLAKANYDLNYEKIQNAKVNLERSKKLYELGIISKAEYEQAELAASDKSIKTLEAQLYQAEKAYKQSENSINQANIAIKQSESGYNQAKAAYEQALKGVQDMIVTSPASGVIYNINVEKGEMASNAQPAITIISLDKVYVKADVTEKLINKFKSGSSIELTVPAVADKKITGKISFINPVANPQTNLYSIEIEINNKNHKIKPGMFAKVEFNTDYKKDVLVVKSEAIIANDGDPIVYVESNGKAIEKKVELGLDNGQYVEIKKGLNINERIIEKGQNYVKNGTVVKVVGGNKK
ncbi:efflux RND transporter periplasmic adaptor subunit [Clostridium brassicae]|uniref:Efflux RND transporter periplasmic adaptor subunit n=1 Tax=Clostridium brassicae TaxID=2999072 RepID=A0ABT4DCI4_9CLOT|nr:efflux RND transporter periplasmic adaptor subunit [Clostridium brassicae]MCY6959373.1 efflux RND transporter periplasmic adaptor subunit [Clostridium brassicae]